MYDDERSKRVLLVAHCVLNQNAKLNRCASYPGAVREVAGAMIDSDVGLLQMPCPELHCLGLDRQAEPDTTATVEEEDLRIARRLTGEQEQKKLRDMVDGLVCQIRQYVDSGFSVDGVVGMDGSPSCGVDRWADGDDGLGPGALIGMLQRELESNGIAIPMTGINARQPKEAVDAVDSLIQGSHGARGRPTAAAPGWRRS
jgi:predicted secreted protein